MMKILLPFLLCAFAVAASAQVTNPIRPDQSAFREIFRELVETNTTLSAGSCTLAAERMARLCPRCVVSQAHVIQQRVGGATKTEHAGAVHDLHGRRRTVRRAARSRNSPRFRVTSPGC